MSGKTNEHDPERLLFAIRRKNYLPKAVGRVSIGRNCSISRDAKIGDDTIIQDNVVIMDRVVIGRGCLIKPGTVIGAKGFSFGFSEDLTPQAIGHSAGVKIGDRVEIGALCTVCQGTVEDTVIEDDVKLDDHIHIAHNCFIGSKSCLTAGVTLGGGVVIEEKCWVGLGATIINKARLGAYTLVGSGANVVRDSEPGEVLVGNPARAMRKRVLC